MVGFEDRRSRLGVAGVIAAVFVTAFTTGAAAEDADARIKPGEETVLLKAGGYLAIFNTEARINASGSGGSKTDLEGDFGIEKDDTSFVGGATWRIAPRHRLDLGFFQFERNATHTAEKNIEIGTGNVIAAGATTDTTVDFYVVPAGYSYSFYKTPEQEIAGSVGVYWYDLDISIAATAFISNASGTGQVSGQADLPLPFLGLRYDYYFNDRWSIGALASYFQLDLTKEFGWKGYLYNVGANVNYWIWNNVGVGAGVNAFGLDVDVEKSEWNGSLKFDYWGPQVFLTARF